MILLKIINNNNNNNNNNNSNIILKHLHFLKVQFGFIYDCLAEEATLGQMNFDPQDFQIFFSDRKKFRKKMENQYQVELSLGMNTRELNLYNIIHKSRTWF